MQWWLLAAVLAVEAEFDIPSGRFLHITDLHLDPYYRVGSSIESGCHVMESGMLPKAGIYGDRNCDTPIKLPRKMLSYIRDNQADFDFIILTGDLPRHDAEDLPKTRGETVAVHLMVRSALAKYFPTKPIVFTIGNNDLIVHDQLGAGPNTDLKAFFLVWRHFIPRDQWKSFLTGGYYTITGYNFPLDIIVLNTMYFYKPNLLVQDCSHRDSPGRQHLKWLKVQLQSCRDRGAFAYLVGHVAPSEKQYLPACLAKFVKLTRKYSDVIHTQMYGHSNYDEFFLGRQETDIEPSKRKKETFGLIAPSMIPCLNPAYRIVTYECKDFAKFGTLLDYDQYYVNLEEANSGKGFRVRLEYSPSTEYGPGPLTAQYYKKLQRRLGVESHLLERYKLNRVVNCIDCLDDAAKKDIRAWYNHL